MVLTKTIRAYCRFLPILDPYCWDILESSTFNDTLFSLVTTPKLSVSTNKVSHSSLCKYSAWFGEREHSVTFLLTFISFSPKHSDVSSHCDVLFRMRTDEPSWNFSHLTAETCNKMEINDERAPSPTIIRLVAEYFLCTSLGWNSLWGWRTI